MVLPFAKDVTLLPGLAWCRSKCRRVIAPSLAASPSAETAIYACSSSRAPAPSFYDRQVGQNTALAPGSPPQRGDCTAMFWQLRSPTSWRGSPGLSWRRDVAMRLVLSRGSKRRRNQACLKPSREVQDGPLRKTATKPKDSCRGLRVGLRKWRNGLTVASVILMYLRPSRALSRMRSDARGYP